MSKFTDGAEWTRGAASFVTAAAKKYAKWIILTVAILFIILAIFNVSILFGMYFFFANLITDSTGLDQSYVRSLSILSVVATLMAAPTIFSWLTFKGDKKKVTIIIVVFTAVTMGVVKYKSSHIFFDSSTGKSLSYYVKTPIGYKFTMDKDKKYDPTFGLKYQAVTQDIVSTFMKEDNKPENPMMFPLILLAAILTIVAWWRLSYNRMSTSCNGKSDVQREVSLEQDKYVFSVVEKDGDLEFEHKACCGGSTKFCGGNLVCKKCGFESYFSSRQRADFLALAHQVYEKKVASKSIKGWMLLPTN